MTPNMTTVAEVFFNASNVQLWYDQYLPASVTEVHKDCMNALLAWRVLPRRLANSMTLPCRNTLPAGKEKRKRL